MIIAVGSKNPIKVSAVRETLLLYPQFRNAKIVARYIPSGVSDQPLTLEEILKGATTRANLASPSADYSLGIESGLIKYPGTERYFDITVCALISGADVYYGQSCAFEVPRRVLDLILTEKINMSEAFHKAGLAVDSEIGKKGGAISVLTRGRMTRKEYTKQAVMMALIPVEQKQLY